MVHVKKLALVIIFAALAVNASSAYAIQEYPGDGVDDLGTNPSPTGGVCPTGYVVGFDQTKCDKALPSPDQDGDVYTSTGTDFGLGTGIDCNDKNKAVYPGVYTAAGYADGTGACIAGQFHLCQASGVYTACSGATICEATGGGTCYYINPSTGNNANAGTSPGTAWANNLKVSDGSGVSVSIGTNDFVYFYTGTYTLTSTSGSRTAVLNLNPGSGNPRGTYKAYPGESPHIAPVCTSTSGCGGIQLSNLTHAVIDGFEVTDTWGGGIMGTGASNVEIKNNHVHGIKGDADNNVSGIIFEAGNSNSDNTNTHHNWVHDIGNFTAATVNGTQTNVSTINVVGTNPFQIGNNAYFINRAAGSQVRRTISARTSSSITFVVDGTHPVVTVNNGDPIDFGNSANKTAYVHFRGTGIKVVGNTLAGGTGTNLTSESSLQQISNCFKIKHQDGTSATTLVVDHNWMYSCKESAIITASGGTFTNNLADDYGAYGFFLADVGGPTNFRMATLVEFNLFLQRHGFKLQPWGGYDTTGAGCSNDCGTPFGTFTVRNNVVQGLSSSWSTADDGFVDLCPYGSNDYRDVKLSGKMLIGPNCYVNTGSGGFDAQEFSSSTVSNQLCATTAVNAVGTEGTNCTNFACWTALGYDTAGFYKTASILDSYFRATGADCQSFGYLRLSQEVTTTTTTSVSTTSTTSTSAATTSTTFSGVGAVGGASANKSAREPR